MYVEYACYDYTTKEDVRKAIFRALEIGVNGISVPHIFLGFITDILAEGIVISSPIDYPLGKSDPAIRQHSIIRALRNGANAIDLVSQSILLLNDKTAEFTSDLSAAKKICDDNGATLRVMVDYRVLSMPLITETVVACKTLGIDYMFMSNGHYVDDYQDNMLLCHKIQMDHEILAICNGNVYLPRHYELIQKAGIFGVRFHKIAALERCLVYNNS